MAVAGIPGPAGFNCLTKWFHWSTFATLIETVSILSDSQFSHICKKKKKVASEGRGEGEVRQCVNLRQKRLDCSSHARAHTHSTYNIRLAPHSMQILRTCTAHTYHTPTTHMHTPPRTHTPLHSSPYHFPTPTLAASCFPFFWVLPQAQLYIQI